MSCDDVGQNNGDDISFVPFDPWGQILDIDAECKQIISVGNVVMGIEVVTDPRCMNHGLGCVSNICRYCKVFDTVTSIFYHSCSTITSEIGNEVGADH